MAHGPRTRGISLAIVVAVLLVISVPPVGPRSPSEPGPAPSNAVVASPSAANGAHPARAAAGVEVAPAFSPAVGVVAVGPLPPASRVSVDVGLAVTDPSALAGLVSALYVPGTSEYRSFLTPSELAQRFGPSVSAVSGAEAYFERFGLSVTTSPDHLLLTVTGPSSGVAAAFGTTFEEYRDTEGRSFFSHSTPATLPTVAPWSGAYGLGNVTPLVPTAGPMVPLRTAAAPAASCSGYVEPLLPCQMWQAYNLTTLISGGTNGSGFRLAVVDAYSSDEGQGVLANDLTTFASDTGITAGPVNYLYPDPTPGNLNSSTNPDWDVEDALDLEWARAAAPGATIDMTFSPDPGPGLYEAVDWLVAHQAADVISMSWGEPDVGVYNAFLTPCPAACNASTDGSYGILSPVLAFAAAEGITVFAASGDCGAADGTSGLATNFPASDPDATGVGGTALSVDDHGDYLSEVAWGGNATGARAPGCANQGGSGGGYSPFPRPGWQTGLPAGTAGRGVPDVALDAATPVLIVFNGRNNSVAGTSLSTPVWGGIGAVADQYAGRPLGLLDPSLYAIASGPNYSRDFHDVLSGNNGYSAGVGWDPVTGLGSPQVASLVADLAHPVSEPSSDLAAFVYATPRFGLAPLTVTFHVNATGGIGMYPLEGVSFGDGNASFAAGGTVTYTYETPGVYSAQSYVSDSAANYSVSPPLAIVVGGGTALSVTLSPSTYAPARGESVRFSVGVTGGVAPYRYNFAFGDGTFLDNASSDTASHVFGADGSFCAAVVVSDSAAPVNGGVSGRAAIGVGGAPLPDCRNDTVPFTMTPTSNVGERDAPADFPDLFKLSGGSTAAGTLPPSVQFTSNDPYLSACACSIFRSPGAFWVNGTASDSENEQATAATDVTVAPPLVGTFTANRTVGPAPLTVGFHANATGGYGTNASTAVWTFGDGTGAVGASSSVTYSQPGQYLALGRLSDRGHGNASEAFLIDVRPSGGSSLSDLPSLEATVTPAVDVPEGAAVNLTARMLSASGSSLPATYLWAVGTGSGAFGRSLNWTYSSPSALAANGTLAITLNATDLTTDQYLNVTLSLPGFAAVESGGFRPRTNALELLARGGPTSGVAPLSWNGVGTITGPGTLLVVWALGNGVEAPNVLSLQEWYFGGLYTVYVNASDSFADHAVDVFSIAVLATLDVTANLSTTNGSAPLPVTFRSNASGGFGPPYEYVWRFGDGGTANTSNTTYTFPTAGTYTTTLNVTDAGGQSAVLNWTVTVRPGAEGLPSAVLLVIGGSVGGMVALASVLIGRRRPPQRARDLGAS